MALELKISSQKYLGRLSVLESQMTMLRQLETEYQDLKGQVNSFAGESDQIAALQTNVDTNIQRVNNAIDATEAAIRTLQANVQSMESASSNISSMIQDSINIAQTIL